MIQASTIKALSLCVLRCPAIRLADAKAIASHLEMAAHLATMPGARDGARSHVAEARRLFSIAPRRSRLSPFFILEA